MNPAMLIDITKCIGCGACARACKESNNLPPEVDPKLTWKTWKVVEKRDGYFAPKACMHCLDPTCASVCPVGAMRKTDLGAVIYHPEICIGCRYCMQACPFHIPKYEWDSPTPVVGKCILCFQRLEKGLAPACATVCPTGATKFGDRDALIREAQKRLLEHPDKYVQHIYGLQEAGGTRIMYLSPIPFEELGLPVEGMNRDFPQLTWKVMKEIPKIFSIAGVMMMGLWWVINRRDELMDKTPEEIKKIEEEKYGSSDE